MKKRNTSNGARMHSHLDTDSDSIGQQTADQEANAQNAPPTMTGELSGKGVGCGVVSYVRNPRPLRFNYQFDKSVTRHFQSNNTTLVQPFRQVL